MCDTPDGEPALKLEPPSPKLHALLLKPADAALAFGLKLTFVPASTVVADGVNAGLTVPADGCDSQLTSPLLQTVCV